MTLADDVEARVHHQLLEGARAGATAPSRATIVELVRREAPLLGAGELDTIVRHVSARTAGLGPLEALLGDPSITEVMVNGPRASGSSAAAGCLAPVWRSTMRPSPT